MLSYRVSIVMDMVLTVPELLAVLLMVSPTKPISLESEYLAV